MEGHQVGKQSVPVIPQGSISEQANGPANSGSYRSLQTPQNFYIRQHAKNNFWNIKI